MSSRARILESSAHVEAFDWSGDGVGRQAAGARAAGARVTPEAGPASAPPEEQRAHLASLEREAFAKGERAGLEAGAMRVESTLHRLAQTLEELGRLRKVIARETEREVVQLALTLARRIVGRDVSLDPMLVAAMAHVALEKLGDSTPATIRLHPDDYAAICAQRGEAWEGARITILPDPEVTRGGCLVESAFGHVDGNLDAQFDQMTRALLGEALETRVVGRAAGD